MRRLVLPFIAASTPLATAAQTVPMIDVEDATPGSQGVRPGGWLHPAIGVDRRNGDFARGDHDDDAAGLGILAAIGVGWGGFYRAGSGDRLFADTGLSLAKLVHAGGLRWQARALMLAPIRDDRLRRLSGLDGETGTVVPLGTLALSFAL